VTARAAERLRAMHHGPRPLVIPNVWDPASAREFAAAGFGALATSSAAVAATLGYSDGQTPGEEMLAAVARIARSVDVPVTADFEHGYDLPPAELASRLTGAGLAGCNLEDSSPVSRTLAEPARQADFPASSSTRGSTSSSGRGLRGRRRRRRRSPKPSGVPARTWPPERTASTRSSRRQKACGAWSRRSPDR
jgi:hypothetical protein